MAQLLFMQADCYRQSAAALLAAKLADAKGNQAEILTTRNDRLANAKRYYEKLIEMFRDKEPRGDLDRLYLKLACFYKADCLYALRDYDNAIAAYDAAATRYKDDASALAAYVQIVNAFCEQRKFDKARRANERAMTLLSRMPQDAFSNGTFSMPKEYWQQWLKWTNGSSGLWNGLEDEKQAAQRFVNNGVSQ